MKVKDINMALPTLGQVMKGGQHGSVGDVSKNLETVRKYNGPSKGYPTGMPGTYGPAKSGKNPGSLPAGAHGKHQVSENMKKVNHKGK